MKWRCRAERVHIYRGNKLKIALNGKHSGTEGGVVLSREKKQSHLQAAIAVCTSAPLHLPNHTFILFLCFLISHLNSLSLSLPAPLSFALCRPI